MVAFLGAVFKKIIVNLIKFNFQPYLYKIKYYYKIF